MPAVDIALGFFQIGFLMKSLDRRALAGLGAARKLHIPIAGFGPAGLNTGHHQMAFRSALERLLQQRAVGRGFPHHVIRWEYSHYGVRIASAHDVRRKTDRRRGIALRRLGHDLALGNARELLRDDLA